MVTGFTQKSDVVSYRRTHCPYWDQALLLDSSLPAVCGLSATLTVNYSALAGWYDYQKHATASAGHDVLVDILLRYLHNANMDVVWKYIRNFPLSKNDDLYLSESIYIM